MLVAMVIEQEFNRKSGIQFCLQVAKVWCECVWMGAKTVVRTNSGTSTRLVLVQVRSDSSLLNRQIGKKEKDQFVSPMKGAMLHRKAIETWRSSSSRPKGSFTPRIGQRLGEKAIFFLIGYMPEVCIGVCVCVYVPLGYVWLPTCVALFGGDMLCTVDENNRFDKTV